MMKNIQEIKQEIAECLGPLDPEKIILFGSYAYGNPAEESDVDIYVVTRDEFMPKNWREKMMVKKAVSSRLMELRKKYPIDLIVHTKPMHKKFVELQSSFSREIMSKGSVIL